ncbi:MAG TPA: hypothetical protein VL443_24305 [Cyclobacteriaceae bacterium]|jgi:hypothetical protein|nr:hypothetical protein [Cyclobacteriaceae bacterium]
MKIFTNVTDPSKKSKSAIMKHNQKSDEERVETGAVVKRNKKGDLERTEGENYQGQSASRVKEDASRMKGNKQYNSGVAPRVGGDGKYSSLAGAVGLMGNASKKQMRQSKRNVNKSAASPQAKRSARKLY